MKDDSSAKLIKRAVRKLEKYQYPHVHKEEEWVATLNVNSPRVDGNPAPAYEVSSFLINDLGRAKFVALWSPTIIQQVIDFLKRELELIGDNPDRVVNKELLTLAKKIIRKKIIN